MAKLNGTHKLLVYADDVNILGESVRTIKKNAEALVVAKEIGLEVNANKTKYGAMSRDQNGIHNHNIRIDNSSFERVEYSNIWERPTRIKILFRKKLRADCSQGMVAIIRCRIFYFPVCYPKI
jgi:hypothetical protein